MQKHLAGIFGVAILLGLGGCSDATTTPTTTSTAEGLWSGNTNTGRTLTAAVLDDGTYYFFYSIPANPLFIAGVIQGAGTSNNGGFNSTNTKDFGIGVAPQNATVSSTFSARQFFNGSINYTTGTTVNFTTSYNTAYDTTPSFTTVAGTYSGQAGSSGGSQPATVTVTADGTFIGTEQNGCQFTGKATARTRGNVFDATMTFGTAPCFFASSTFQGIAYFDIPNHRLFAAAPNSTRTDAAIFFSTL
jgi:hypothetical protein